MSVNPEKEIPKVWKALHAAQDEKKKTFYQWRAAAIELAGPDANPLDIVLKAWEVMGEDVGQSFLPRYNWARGGEEGFMKQVAGAIAGIGMVDGAVVKVEKGENPKELLITWDRCPWPSFASKYDAPMEEDVLGCDKFLETIIQRANEFMNTNLKIETLKAIPKGDGVCVRRLYVE